MTPIIRLAPFESLNGAWNMATDEMLLEEAARGIASLRFYLWSEPTLSLGYFQAGAERSRDPRWERLPWVRRASGGATLLHHHELTYALALPPGALWQGGEPWACRFHHLIADTLRSLQVEALPVLCGHEKRLGDFLCFLDQTAGDLLANSSKIVGSAQRKWKGALLQHGGILLARSVHTPELPGIREQSGIDVEPVELMDKLVRSFAQETKWDVQPHSWTEDELQRRRALVEQKYGNPIWNEKR